MSEMQHRDPFDNLDSEHLRTLDEFDCLKSQFYDWLAVESVTPSTLTYDSPELQEYTDDVSTAFVELAISCHDNAPDIDTAKSDITELWRQDETQRVQMFIDTAANGDFVALTKEEIEQVVESIFTESEDESDLAQNIRQMYGGYLKGDVLNLVGCLEHQAEVSMAENDSEAYEEVLLDIDLIDAAKKAASFMIVAGLGMIIGKKFLK